MTGVDPAAHAGLSLHRMTIGIQSPTSCVNRSASSEVKAFSRMPQYIFRFCSI